MKPEEKVSSEDAGRLINELSIATQRYGLSTADTWNRLIIVARALGWNARFIATPNYVQSVLWQDDETDQRIHFITERSGNYDLDKLAQIRELMREIQAGSVSPAQGLKRLREIVRAPAAYGPSLNALAYVLCGAGFAVLLHTSWMDVLFGGLISLASFTIALWAEKSSGVATLMEMLAAMICAVLAGILSMLLPGSDPLAITVCAVIVFVPGFGLTVAPNELIMGNTLSGLVWFSNAFVAMLKLLGGAVLGITLVQRLWQVTQPEPGVGVTLAWSWIFAPFLAIGLAILFRVPKRELVWTMLGAWVVWGGVQAGNAFGFWQGTFLGATVLILFGNLCYRFLRISVAVIVLPCIMLLVPGVATLRALYIAQTQGAAAGLQSGSQILALIAAILGGDLVGSAILSSIEASKSRLSR